MTTEISRIHDDWHKGVPLHTEDLVVYWKYLYTYKFTEDMKRLLTEVDQALLQRGIWSEMYSIELVLQARNYNVFELRNN